jgi:hypothetical protein
MAMLVVVLLALRIASQRCGVVTASTRLRSRLAGVLRYLPAAIHAGTIGGFSLAEMRGARRAAMLTP